MLNSQGTARCNCSGRQKPLQGVDLAQVGAMALQHQQPLGLADGGEGFELLAETMALVPATSFRGHRPMHPRLVLQTAV